MFVNESNQGSNGPLNEYVTHLIGGHCCNRQRWDWRFAANVKICRCEGPYAFFWSPRSDLITGMEWNIGSDRTALTVVSLRHSVCICMAKRSLNNLLLAISLGTQIYSIVCKPVPTASYFIQYQVRSLGLPRTYSLLLRQAQTPGA